VKLAVLVAPQRFEITQAPVNAVELADVRLGDDVLIIGAGFMGNLVQKLVSLRGPRHVIVADTRPDALERAAELGATRVVDVRSESLPEVVAGLTGGIGADVTFEVTGAQGPLATVGEVTRMSGKIVLVGYHQGAPRQIRWVTGTGWRSRSSTRTSGRSRRSCAG